MNTGSSMGSSLVNFHNPYLQECDVAS